MYKRQDYWSSRPAPGSFLKKWKKDVTRLKKLGKNVKGLAGVFMLIGIVTANGEAVSEQVRDIQWWIDIYRDDPSLQNSMEVCTRVHNLFPNEYSTLNLWQSLQK